MSKPKIGEIWESRGIRQLYFITKIHENVVHLYPMSNPTYTHRTDISYFEYLYDKVQ